MKEYKLRIVSEVPEATSGAVAGWLEDALKTSASLTDDPGGGEAFVNLSLDEAKVAELSNRHGCKPPVALRRLIASNVSLAAESPKGKSAGAVVAELLPGKVLPKKLEYKGADLLSLVRGLDYGMMHLYRQLYGLPELTAARTPEADAELAAAMAECVNRRAPEWLLQNADLAKLLVSSVRWSLAQTDELEKQIAAIKAEAKKKAAGVSSLGSMNADDLRQAVGEGVEVER